MKHLKSVSYSGVLALAFFPIQNAGAWGQFDGGHHPDYNRHFERRAPVVVHNTYVTHDRGGCAGCGVGVAAVAGLLGGAIIGAAIAGGGQPAPPPPTIVEQPAPVIVQAQAQPQPVVYQQAAPQLAPGMAVSGLPPGCASMNVNGSNYFQCGPTWYQPFVGGNGVYYVVVNAP